MQKKRTLNQRPTAVTFRRFSRGGWAVFASLSRTVRIGVLTVGMLGSVCIEKVDAHRITSSGEASATGDDAEADERELSEVTVAGSMAPLTQLQSARIVGVITRQQIEAAAAQTVNDLLKLASGVDVRQRGGFGIQTDISIDGGTFDQITILLNGTNISNPHTGHLAADFPVSLSDIERIEVLEGAASRVYGASAFGGAINIVTKKASPTTPLPKRGEYIHEKDEAGFEVEAGLHGGSYGTFGGEARIALQHSKVSTPLPKGRGDGLEGTHSYCSLSGSYQRSDGTTTNSDFSRGNVFLRGEWTPVEAVNLDLQAGWSTKSYGANTFYSAAYPNQWESNDRILVSVGAETKGRVRLRPEIYWNRSTDHFQLIRNTASGENFHRTDVAGSHLTLDFQWAAGHTAVGAEVRTEGIYSTNLGRPIASAMQSSSPSDNEQPIYTRHDRRTNLSFNLEHNVVLERFTASVGVLAHCPIAAYPNGKEPGFSFYPGVDIAYRPATGWKLFASYNKGFRLPTFTDLYYKAPTHEGNTDLKAEESHSVQIGATWHTPIVQATARAFYHRGTHMIDWVMYSADDVFHSSNFDLDNLGIQAEVRANLAEAFGSNDAYLQRASVAYTYMHQNRRDDIAVWKSNYAMEYLRHKFVATLNHRIWNSLSADWSLRWQDRMGAYILYADAKSTGELVDYSPYATLDIKLRWNRPRYEIWVEATNITNTTYYDLGNVPQPGIMVLAGAKLRLP